MVRTGVNRRQVPQLRKQLEEGIPVKVIATNFNVYPEVVFTFAKSWDIKVEDTPESLEHQRQEAKIEQEVKKRVKKKERKKAKDKEELDALAAENREVMANLKSNNT